MFIEMCFAVLVENMVRDDMIYTKENDGVIVTCDTCIDQAIIYYDREPILEYDLSRIEHPYNVWAIELECFVMDPSTAA